MKKRNFLKALIAAPFVGTTVAQMESAAALPIVKSTNPANSLLSTDLIAKDLLSKFERQVDYTFTRADMTMANDYKKYLGNAK